MRLTEEDYRSMMLIVQFVSVLALCLVSTTRGQGSGTLSQETCENREVNIQAGSAAVIGGLFSIHSPRGTREYGCGPPSTQSMQTFEAVRWILDILNKKNITISGQLQTDSYIPGVKLGMKVVDTCTRVEKALGGATELFPNLGGHSQSCSIVGNEAMLGILDMNPSSIAMALSHLGQQHDLPVVSSAATSSRLSNKLMYPNFMRTIQPESKGLMRAINAVLRQLHWSYITVVHTDDARSRENFQAFLRNIDPELCVGAGIRMSETDTSDAAMNQALAQIMQTESVGVLFLGVSDVAESLLKAAATYSNSGKLQWIFTDSISLTAFSGDKVEYPRGIIAVHPFSRRIVEFEDHWIRLNEKSPPTENPWYQEWYMMENDCFIPGLANTGFSKECPSVLETTRRQIFVQDSLVEPAMLAVYTYARALRDAQAALCNNRPGLCSRLTDLTRNEFFNTYLKRVNIIFLAQERVPSLASYIKPYEAPETLKFDGNLDIVNTAYEVYNFNRREGYYKFRRVATITESTASIIFDGIQMFDNQRANPLPVPPESSCPSSGGCNMCLGPNYQPKYLFIGGDIILSGLFSVHNAGPTPLTCGTIDPLMGAQNVEAMKWAIQNQPANILNGVSLGMVAFDDCDSSMIAQNIAYVASSGMMRIEDAAGEKLDPRSVEGYIASASSSLSIAFSEFINRIHKPQISYAATSPTLSDQRKFPYFLRTIPSDTDQVRAIVMLLKRFGWTNVQAIQEPSSFGRDGIKELKKIGAEEGICVVAVHEPGTHGDMEFIIERLRAKPWAQPVIVYMDQDAIKDLLRALNSTNAKGEFVLIGPETWGTNMGILNDVGDVAVGSITVEPAALSFPRFQTYLAGLDVTSYSTNPWFQEWYEALHNCSIAGIHSMYPSPCTVRPITDTSDYRTDLYSRYVIAAVNVFAEGLDLTLTEFCGNGYSGVCSKFLNSPNRIEAIMRNIERSDFTDDSRTNFQFFKRAGDLPFTIYSVYGQGQGYVMKATYSARTNVLDLTDGTRATTVDTWPMPEADDRTGHPKRPTDVKTQCPDQCLECMYMFSQQKYLHKSGDIVIPAVFDVHNAGESPFSCGDLREDGFLTTEAFTFAIDSVNQGLAPVKLNGVTLGGLAFDGCNNPLRTSQLISSFVGFNGLGIPKLTNDRHLGWMTFSSEGTIEVVDTLQNLGIPLVSPGATMPGLNDRLKPPGTFFRTVPSDGKVVKALLQIAKEMGFNYTVVLNSPDYGSRAARDEFRDVARDYGICIAATFEFETDGSAREIVNKIAKYETDIVVVFSESNSALGELLDAKTGRQRSPNLLFLSNRDFMRVIRSTTDPRRESAWNAISVDVEKMKIDTLTDRLIAAYVDPESKKMDNPWFAEHFQNDVKCSLKADWTYDIRCIEGDQTHRATAENIKQGRWVIPTIDAVYSYTHAVHLTLQEKCGNNYASLCNAFTTDDDVYSLIVKNLDVVKYRYPGNEEFQFINRESNRRLEAVRVLPTSGGDIEKITTIIEELGYVDSEGDLTPSLETTLMTRQDHYNQFRDQCEGRCEQCVNPSQTSDQFTYQNADILLAGLFDVHEAGPTPFTCGNINTKNGFALLEAFNFAIEYVNSGRGIFNNILRSIRFGGVAFDVCQQPDRAGNIVANIHSGNRPLVWKNQIIDPDRFDVYIGPFDTESTIRVADVLDVIGIPQVSYGATSLELRDARRYRYFLRSVPADDKQARALISYLKFAEINYVQVINTFNSVGEMGRQEFMRLAYLNRICIAQNITVGKEGPVTLSEAKQAVELLLKKPRASTVILFVDEPRPVLQAIEANKDVAGKYLVIGTDKWGADPSMLVGLDKMLAKSVTLDIETADVPEFDHYLENKKPSNYHDNPWFDEYYETLFGCQVTGSGSQKCTQNVGISRALAYKQDPYSLYVMNAVFSAAFGVHSALTEQCGRNYVGACQDFRRSGEKRQFILQGMKRVNFTDWTYQPFYFTPGGESDRGYHIYRVLQDPILKMFVYENVGSYNDTHFLKIDAAYRMDHSSSCNTYTLGDCVECAFPEYHPSRYMLKKSPEDLNVVSILNIHKAGSTPFSCGELDLDLGFQNLLAFFYAIDLVNQNEDRVFQATLRLGGLALDTCSSPIRLGQDLYGLLSGEGLCGINDRTGQLLAPSSIVAYIPDGSSNSIITSSILSPRKVTSFSQSATSVELSNRDVHGYFLRTVPPDDRQALVIVDIMNRMGFNYASVVYSYNDYGKSGLELLLKNAQLRNTTTCVGATIPMFANASAEDARGIISDLRNVVGGRAVILFVTQQHARLLLEAARDLGILNRFVWIGSDTWADSTVMVEGVEDEAQGAITIQIHSEIVEGFKTYMKDLTLSNRKGIPDDWFEEFYQRIHKCRIIDSVVPLTFPRLCNTNEAINIDSIIQNPYVLHTMIATYMVAQGLNNIEECKRTSLNIAGCLELQNNKRQLIYDSVAGAQWNVLPEDLGNNSFAFRLTSDGYGDIQYNILNYYRDRTSGRYVYQKLGSWQGSLTLDPEVYRGFSSSQVPMSRCPVGSQCTCQAMDGASYKFRSETSSTLYTVNVGENYVDPVSGTVVSGNSQPGLADRFMDAWGTIVATCAGIGLFISFCLFIYLLIVYPVRNGTSILGYMLVFGLILMFAMVFPFILHANNPVCGLRRFGLGIVYSICFAALFIKLIDAWRTRHKEEFSEVKYEKLGRPMGLLFIACCLVGIQILINAEWLILQPPVSEFVIYNAVFWPRCSPDQDQGMMKNYDTGLVMSLIYVMFLIFLCIIFGACTWSVRKNHREASFILGVSLFSVLIWVPWCLASTLTEYKIRDPAVAIGLLVNAFVILMFIPLRKMYLFNRYQKMMKEEEDGDKNHYLITNGKTEDYSQVYGHDGTPMYPDNASELSRHSRDSRDQVHY